MDNWCIQCYADGLGQLIFRVTYSSLIFWTAAVTHKWFGLSDFQIDFFCGSFSSLTCTWVLAQWELRAWTFPKFIFEFKKIECELTQSFHLCTQRQNQLLGRGTVSMCISPHSSSTWWVGFFIHFFNWSSYWRYFGLELASSKQEIWKPILTNTLNCLFWIFWFMTYSIILTTILNTCWAPLFQLYSQIYDEQYN